MLNFAVEVWYLTKFHYSGTFSKIHSMIKQWSSCQSLYYNPKKSLYKNIDALEC